MCSNVCTLIFYSIICVVQCLKIEPADGEEQNDAGIFETFAKNLLFTLSSGFLNEKTLQQYLRNVEQELLQLEYRYTKKLADVVGRIAKNRDEIRDNLQDYIDALDDKGPKLKEFLKAMDKVYTPLHAMRFNDFILDLQDYGREAIPAVGAETRKILRDVIVGGICGRPQHLQKELHDKLVRAVKEYRQ